jgi:hypothetical protein
MSSAVRAIASRTIALTTATALGLIAAAALSLGTTAMAASSLDELNELNLRAWNGEPELLDQVYAPDGVHTATYYDITTEFPGPDRIASVAGHGIIEQIGPRIDISVTEGDWRWASFASLAGGTACLFRAVDGLIVRHDCVLPKGVHEHRSSVGLADAEASAEIDAIMERLSESWGTGSSVEALAEVYAPDAVHRARFLNTTKSYTGPEEIYRVAGYPGAVEPIGERVDFEAPAGELAWAGVSDVAGGSVCLFHAVDGLVTRHDCVLPIAG